MNENVRLIRLPEVIRQTGLSRSTLYQLAADGRFPKPVRLGERCSAWPESEVLAWCAERIRESREAA